MRIDVIRGPAGEDQLVLARAVLRPERLALLGHDPRLDAGLREGRLDRLRDLRKRGVGERIDTHLEPVAVARLREQGLRLPDVEPIRGFGVSRPQPARPERLVHHELAGEEGVRHAVVIDRVP